jgi:hypothetical protein
MILVLNNSEKAPDNALDINVTSRSTTWSRGLSPFIIEGGKVWTGDYAKNVENLWQYCKVYENHVDSNGDPTKEWFDWAKKGWNTRAGVRYPMGKGAIPLYSYWDGKKYGYLDAKEKLYVKMYSRSVCRTEAYKKLEELYKDCLKENTTLVMRDFDAYNHVNLKLTPYEVLRHERKKFGHGFVLMFMLLGLLDEKGNFIKEKKNINDIKFF